MALEHVLHRGRLDRDLARLRAARGIRAGPASVPDGRSARHVDLRDVPGSADAPVHPARGHHPGLPAREHPLGVDPHVPDVFDPVLHVAPHGVLQDDPQGAGGVRAHRRGDPLRRDDADHLPDRGARDPSAGIFAFTLSWNEFIYALIFLSSPERKTVPVGVVSELIRGDIYFWGQLMAGALLGSIPVALVYSFFVEYYVTGLTGSVKG